MRAALSALARSSARRLSSSARLLPTQAARSSTSGAASPSVLVARSLACSTRFSRCLRAAARRGPQGGPHGLGRARRAHKGERRGWACSAVLHSLTARLSTIIILYAHEHQAPHLALFLTLSYILSLMRDKRS